MSRVCEMCPENTPNMATIFCPPDSSYLCSTCDEEVHNANRLASRHVRRPLINDELDGSSINDESELGLVPDVIQSQSDDQPTNISMSFIDEQWMTANGIKSTTIQDSKLISNDNGMIPLQNDLSLNFDDIMHYDLPDFDGLPSKLQMNISSLTPIDHEEQLWNNSTKSSKHFNTDISPWDIIVNNDHMEHVVPDIETNISSMSSRLGVSSSCDTNLADELSSMINDHIITLPESIKKEEEIIPVVVSPPVKTDNKTQLNKTEPTVVKSEIDIIKSQSEKDAEAEAKSLEIRKKKRMEALARFRSKRANRSFTKKVRYECRKQLADSRPRVKGRFVRKIEMALFRKYGAMYREHLDELKNENTQGLTAL